MNPENIIMRIAIHLADRVRAKKRPYSELSWIVENHGHLYSRVTKAELVTAHLWAINILKRDGVENAKRKPLSSLSKELRSSMRSQAREFAALIQRFLGDSVLVSVSRSPIKTDKDGVSRVWIEVNSGAWTSCRSLEFKALEQWTALSEPAKTTEVYRFSQQFRSCEELLQDNIELIRAKLESGF